MSDGEFSWTPTGFRIDLSKHWSERETMSGTPERLADERERLADALIAELENAAKAMMNQSIFVSRDQAHLRLRNAREALRAELLRAAPPPQDRPPNPPPPGPSPLKDPAYLIENNPIPALRRWLRSRRTLTSEPPGIELPPAAQFTAAPPPQQTEPFAWAWRYPARVRWEIRIGPIRPMWRDTEYQPAEVTALYRAAPPALDVEP